MSSCSRRYGSTVAGYVDAHLCCRMSQVGIELFSCGAAITDGFPSVSCQRIRRYHSSNRCAKLSVCRRPNDPRASVRMGTCWRRTPASSAGKSAAVQPPTTAAIGRTTADSAARPSAPPNASVRNHRSLGGLTSRHLDNADLELRNRQLVVRGRGVRVLTINDDEHLHFVILDERLQGGRVADHIRRLVVADPER